MVIYLCAVEMGTQGGAASGLDGPRDSGSGWRMTLRGCSGTTSAGSLGVGGSSLSCWACLERTVGICSPKEDLKEEKYNNIQNPHKDIKDTSFVHP